ncbi:MAG: EAL domain-containing protein [Methylococcales bacterium]
MQNIKITLIQSNIIWENAVANLEKYSEMISGIESTDVIILPEMFSTGFSMQPEKLKETMNGSSVEWMRKVAREMDAAIVGSLIIEENKQLREDFTHSVQSLQSLYQTVIKERTHKLEATLTVMIDDVELRSAFKTADREALLARVEPLFQQLKSKHKIAHFYFHNAQSVNLLRVHQPERYGDTIDRFTMHAAARSGEMSSGTELGPLGTFTLRVVSPVHEGDRLLGYIELGEEIDGLVGDMAHVSGSELIVTIDKRFLKRADWEMGMRIVNRESNWDYLPDRVIVSRTLAEAPEAHDLLLHSTADYPADGTQVSWGGRHYLVAFVALRDAGDREVGKLLILRDMTARISSNHITIFFIIAGTVLLGSLLFAFSFRLLGWVERRIRDDQANIADSEQHMRLHYERTPLGVIEWDTDFQVVDWNPAAERIFGYSKEEALGQRANFIVPGHERNAVDTVWQNLMTNRDVIHQVNENITREGQSRLCEWYNTPLVDTHGKVIGVASLVDDITEKRKAELLSARMGRIFEQSWNEIYTFDASTLYFAEVSDGACHNLGYTLDELRLLTPVDLKPEFTVEQFEALIGPLRRGEKQTVTFDTEHRRKDGSCYSVEVRVQLSGAEMPPVFIAIIQDISERKRYIADLEHKALYDALTDLPNRTLLHDRLEHSLKVAHRETLPLAVLMIDVARLGEINDLLGHQSGDVVMQKVATRLQRQLRKSDTIARLSGDEFVLVLSGVGSKQVYATVEKIQRLFEQAVVVNDASLEIEVAIGIALYPDHGDEPKILLQHTDIAMRVAKNEATGFSIYNPESDPFCLRRLKLHGELRQAINEKSFALYYQPKIDIKTNRITSVEALARWQHPVDGMIAPDDFIPMIEQSGLIQPFTLWVLEQAIEQCKHWTDTGIDISIAVNLSTRNLLDPDLPGNIAKLLESYKVAPECLSLEITESAVMSRPENALKVLMQLDEMGLKLSIDDFGTGYSSLAYLKKLPVHELKIDQSFVFGMTTNENDAVIVRSTIDLAHNLGLHAVAEGVENQDTLDLLAILNCDIAQGYLMGRPMPIQELNQWLIRSPWGLQDLTS